LIAADSSSVRRYLEDQIGADTASVQQAVRSGELRVPPIVVTELFSDPNLPEEFVADILALPLLESIDGLWVRAGILRAHFKRQMLKANIADCLVAQACIDADIPLITYDRDFRHFQRVGLKFA
jgi:predicted nucleic acid-binding protein